jgi:hypothetical protein
VAESQHLSAAGANHPPAAKIECRTERETVDESLQKILVYILLLLPVGALPDFYPKCVEP